MPIIKDDMCNSLCKDMPLHQNMLCRNAVSFTRWSGRLTMERATHMDTTRIASRRRPAKGTSCRPRARVHFDHKSTAPDGQIIAHDTVGPIKINHPPGRWPGRYLNNLIVARTRVAGQKSLSRTFNKDEDHSRINVRNLSYPNGNAPFVSCNQICPPQIYIHWTVSNLLQHTSILTGWLARKNELVITVYSRKRV